MATATATRSTTRKPRTTKAAAPAPVIEQPPLKSTIRAGVIMSIGMVNLIVSVYSAMDEDTADTTNVCLHPGTEHDGSALSSIRQRRFCPVCDAEHGFSPARKVDGGYVVLTPELTAQAKEADAAHSKSIDVKVHRTADLNGAMPTGKTYYLTSKAGPAQEAYATVAATLQDRPDLTLVTEFAMKGAASLYQIIADNGTLILRQLARPTLIRQRPALETPANDALVGQLSSLLDASVTDFDPLAYANDRSKLVDDFVAKATPQAAVTADGTTPADAPSTDFTAMLAAAVAQQARPARRRAPRKTTEVAV